MTETAIHGWLNRDTQPADLYELLGRPRFDPDREALLAIVRTAYASLLPYQNHSERRLSRRAVELQRELGRAEGILSDPKKLRVHHDMILERLSSACDEARRIAAEPWSQQRLCEWLRQQAVHPDRISWVASCLSLRVAETLVLDHCETEENLAPTEDSTGFILEDEQARLGFGGSRPRVFGTEEPSVEGRERRAGPAEAQRCGSAAGNAPANREEPISAIVLPSMTGDEPVSAVVLPGTITTSRRRQRNSRQKPRSRWSAGLAKDRTQQFFFFLLLAGLLLLGLLTALAVLSG